jgi:xanthine dehydrogenase accessory factor
MHAGPRLGGDAGPGRATAMISDRLTERVHELATKGEAFVTATVVRVQHPTSVEPGTVALVRGDGTIEGFVGGVCAEHSVRLYSLKVIDSGEPLLLKILPDGPEPTAVSEGIEVNAGHEIASEDGTVTVKNPCLSGGALEIFLEPLLPAPRVTVAGNSLIAAAVRSLGPELGFEIVTPEGTGAGSVAPYAEDLALVVAAHGRDELSVLRAGLEAGVPYVGLVASRKRGAAVIEELREDGVAQELLDAIETPAGIDIGARTPAEIALSILAQIVALRRGKASTVAGRTGRGASAAAAAATTSTAVDPICGMTVVVLADTPTVEHDGESSYFCCEGCKRTFEQQRAA